MSDLEFIRQHYDRHPQHEWERAERHRTEFAITWKALEAYLPPPPARLLDCGGGPGRYAIALAQSGYTVTLFDLSPENLAFARRQAQAAGLTLQGYDIGDAIDLSRYADGSFDAVLLLGPLYHLLELEQRQRALQEARRVLRPGGVLFAAFINRYAGHIRAAGRDPLLPVREAENSASILSTGKLASIENHAGAFRAHMAHPSEVSPLIWSAGFEHLETLNLEGLIGGCEGEVNALQGEAWEAWLAINWQAARDPSLFGASQHLLAVARRPLWRDALRKLAGELAQAGIDYTLTGSANLALHGVPLPAKDLDLEMSAQDAVRFQQRYAPFAVMPVALRQDERYRSYFGRFEIDGVTVEVMGDLKRREGVAWKPSANSTRELLDLDGVAVQAAWLEEETLANLRRGRLERAALCLPYCSPERLAALLTRQIATQVI
jgi:S-adenosylmethionine-dependent methyltransferase